MLCRQCHTRSKLVLPCESNPAVHQCLVFSFGAAVATQEPASGQRQDLVVDQLLFGETVAVALELALGVALQCLQEVVRADKGALVGEARISLDQGAAVRRRKDREQAGAVTMKALPELALTCWDDTGTTAQMAMFRIRRNSNSTDGKRMNWGA
ncbi:hypothetical protein [Actimicrobium sp. CCI2.3]|uniref:hypothetical protein n=1 Tax=Actimicrobium sp. CCI2.3 TaxID=3048616 RepID=UPI002AB44A07|nr:hypothetical protein [Actimicrobium sp. CCI2.3]MDY7575170.1 hypothetical protein [Actimicrobium sp. CCI2.3]MEB0023578.1 hypothetical protein [Actimicrobium sp. CCI2.3]